MKKCLSIALCLMMLFSLTAVSAEGKAQLGTVEMNGAFELRGVLPEGYTAETLVAESAQYIAQIKSADAAKPVLSLSIAYDELLCGVERLNDLDQESLKKIEATFQAEDQVEITYTETSHGTKLMVIKETRDSVDYVDFYTIYLGYQIEFVLTKGEAAAQGITDEQIQMAISFLSDLDFVPLKAAE